MHSDDEEEGTIHPGFTLTLPVQGMTAMVGGDRKLLPWVERVILDYLIELPEEAVLKVSLQGLPAGSPISGMRRRLK